MRFALPKALSPCSNRAVPGLGARHCSVFGGGLGLPQPVEACLSLTYRRRGPAHPLKPASDTRRRSTRSPQLVVDFRHPCRGPVEFPPLAPVSQPVAKMHILRVRSHSQLRPVPCCGGYYCCAKTGVQPAVTLMPGTGEGCPLIVASSTICEGGIKQIGKKPRRVEIAKNLLQRKRQSSMPRPKPSVEVPKCRSLKPAAPKAEKKDEWQPGPWRLLEYMCDYDGEESSSSISSLHEG